MYTTFIADDELIIRQGLRCILELGETRFQIIGEAANGSRCFGFIIKIIRFGLVRHSNATDSWH